MGSSRFRPVSGVIQIKRGDPGVAPDRHCQHPAAASCVADLAQSFDLAEGIVNTGKARARLFLTAGD